jgi:hypothetical protein
MKEKSELESLRQAELEQLLELAWPGWGHFKADLVNQPGYEEKMEDFCKHAFIAGVISAHMVSSFVSDLRRDGDL